MTRKPRIHFANVLYHVIARGNQRQRVFYDDRDIKTFLSFLSGYKSRYRYCLYACALIDAYTKSWAGTILGFNGWKS